VRLRFIGCESKRSAPTRLRMVLNHSPQFGSREQWPCLTQSATVGFPMHQGYGAEALSPVLVVPCGSGFTVVGPLALRLKFFLD